MTIQEQQDICHALALWIDYIRGRGTFQKFQRTDYKPGVGVIQEKVVKELSVDQMATVVRLQALHDKILRAKTKG